MSSFVPHTRTQRAAMLTALGLNNVDELFGDVPQAYLNPKLDLPSGASELEVDGLIHALAARNTHVRSCSRFLGAGVASHFIPAVVDAVISRGEFATSYTPYQPEISQGTLTTIYEYQSLMCELTGMDVANASMYDGATALAEAVLMSCHITGRSQVIVAPGLNPLYYQVTETYACGQGVGVTALPRSGGDAEGVMAEPTLTRDAACLVVQQPNFFGCLQPVSGLAERVNAQGALLVVVVDPISLALLKPPGQYGADIVVGEGQGLGTPLQFGGPYLGLFACRQDHIRQMPGRLVGQTSDANGRRGFVMTFQAREQHIRREKATSNICSNETLVALAATVYLSALGPGGLRAVAQLCYDKAHYAATLIRALPKFELLTRSPYFNEFVIRCPRDPDELNRRLLERGMIGGLPLSRFHPDLADAMLLCVTEMNPRADIDRLVAALGELA